VHVLSDLMFFQAVITSMYPVLYCMSDVRWGWFQVFMAVLGLAGPAVNLSQLMPRIVGKAVMVTSIEHMKDKHAVKQVIFDTKKHQLLESLKLLEIARMEGKVERIWEEVGVPRELRSTSSPSRQNTPITPTVSGFEGIDEPEENIRWARQVTPFPEKCKQKYTEIFQNNFSSKKKADIKNMFQLFDADGSGSIEKEEMFAVFSSLHVDLSGALMSSADRLWEVVDIDGSGSIDYDEYCVLIAMLLHKDEKTKRLDDEALFQKFDEDGSGEITMDEMVAGFESLGVELDAESMANLVGEVFHQSRSRLTIEDFIKFMNGLEEMSEKAF